MQHHLEDRLEALERAVTDGETDLGALVDGAATAERVATLESRLDTLEDEVGELDASLQAVRGYVGELQAVNTEVEETAAAAMAKAERAADRRETRRRPPAEAGGEPHSDRQSPATATNGHTDHPAGEAGRSGRAVADRSREYDGGQHPGEGGPPAACPTCGRDPDPAAAGVPSEPVPRDRDGGYADPAARSSEAVGGPLDEPTVSEPADREAGVFGRVRNLL